MEQHQQSNKLYAREKDVEEDGDEEEEEASSISGQFIELGIFYRYAS